MTDTTRAFAPPAVDAWAPALLDACTAIAGGAVRYAHDPAALPHAQGPWVFGFQLAPAAADVPGALAQLGAGWDQPLVARLGTMRADLEREAAAMDLSRAHGRRTPVVRGLVTLDTGSAGPLWALVTDAVTDVALPDLIVFNLNRSEDLLHGFAEHHAAIHRLPIDGLVVRGDVPAISLSDELARIDRGRFGAELTWLDQHRPEPATPVLCHGGFQPLAVFGPSASEWDEHGGPGRDLTVTNWCGAVLAEPEFDVAFTLVAFWSAPFFAPNRSERTAIKMIRNTLLNTYKTGYTANHPIDPDRLRFWQAFHALRGLARMAGAYDEDGSPFQAVDRGELPAELANELQRHFRQLTRRR